MGTNRLSDRAVADMIKRRATTAGLDGAFAGHSLRAGFATEGYAQGTPELAIMRHGRWRSAAVMRGYVGRGGRHLERQRCCPVGVITGIAPILAVQRVALDAAGGE